jgi:hypothetical protein
MSLEDLFFGDSKLESFCIPNKANTLTRKFDYLPIELLKKTNVGALMEALSGFNDRHKELFERDRASLYRTFPIPKKFGGLRRIDAPIPELMSPLRELKLIFEIQFKALYHTAAFAYIKERSTVDCIKRHQANESRWFMKLDFHNFFGSATPEFVMSMLSEIFPFCEICKSKIGYGHLSRALSLCFLNGGLPQGTPISPLIINLMMIPIDHFLANKLRNFEKNHFIYTRYADDILVSGKYDFDPDKMTALVKSAINKFNAPFTLNEEKTRYGSSSGSNWNLGVILNKDNEITVGYKNKKYFKAMLNAFILDTKNGTAWSLEDVRHLDGLRSYYSMVEKDNIKHILTFFNQKYNVNVEKMLRAQLKVVI